MSQLLQAARERGDDLQPLYSISSISRRCDVTVQTVRNWVGRGRIVPRFRDVESGRLYFGVEDVERLAREQMARGKISA